MSIVRPRQLVHRGVVLARGIAIDASLVGEAEARARALDESPRGAVVQQAGDVLVLRFGAPRFLDAGDARGAPLVAAGERLVAAPLTKAELASLDGPTDAIVLVRDGIAVPFDPRGLPAVDLALWIDLSDVTRIDVASLGLPAPPIEDVAPPVTNARAVLGVAPGSPERQRVLDAMVGEAKRGETAGTGPSLAVRSSASLLAGIARFFAFILAFRRTSRAPSNAGAPAPGGASSPRARAIARASLFDRLEAWVHNTLARALAFARLADRIGAQHAKHLRDVLDMMDRGEYAEALRHAVPVGGPIDEEAARIALRAKTAPRASLEIRPEETRARAIVPFGDDLQAHLRQKYRMVFERLAALGRNEEAAFVLAELLHANEEAVSFLEKVGQKRLAAELAEARGLPPGLVVRQWFVAGDLARAIRVARRTDSFADALVRLEKRSRDDADALRVAWAESVANTGNFALAQEIVWPVEAARGVARVWLDLAIEAGGPGAAKALVRKLSVAPDAYPSVRADIDSALASSDSANALAETLLATPSTPTMRHLARAAARGFLRLPKTNQKRKKLGESLFTYSGDPALKADVPFFDTPGDDSVDVALASRESVLTHRFAGAASSGPAARTAVRLPRGRTLVALGEAGASVLSADGGVVFHIDEPAHDLVISDGGDRALLLAPRGDMVRIARVDLLRRRAAHWTDVRLSRWARDFDGGEWFIAQDNVVLAIDAYDDARFAASWQVDVEAPVVAIARAPRTLAIQVGPLGEPTVWRYDLPSMTLRAREAHPIRGTVLTSALSASGAIAASVSFEDDSHRSELYLVVPETFSRSALTMGSKASVCIDETWVAVLDGGTARLVTRDLVHRKERCNVIVDGSIVSARIHAGALTIVDSHGTIVHVDLTTGAAAAVHMKTGR